MTVKIEKSSGNLFKVSVKLEDGWRLKAKHMNKEKAEKFAKSLGYKPPHKKGSKEPSKTAVKLAKKPGKKSSKKGG